MAPNILDPVTNKSENGPNEGENAVRSRILANSEKSNLNETWSNNNNNSELRHSMEASKPQEEFHFKPKIRWPDLIAQVFVHGGALYGLYYLITLQAAFLTYIWCEFSIKFSCHHR